MPPGKNLLTNEVSALPVARGETPETHRIAVYYPGLENTLDL